MSSQRDQRVLLYDLRRELEIIKTRLIGLEYQNSVLEFQLNQAEIQVDEVSLGLEDSVESRDVSATMPNFSSRKLKMCF